MNKPYGLIHVTKERSLSMLVDVCQCGHTHDSHKYLDIFYFGSVALKGDAKISPISKNCYRSGDKRDSL